MTRKSKTSSQMSVESCLVEEQEYVRKSSFIPRLPEKFCPNKFFGRKKRHPFSEHFNFFINTNWMSSHPA